tara:strand:+ start:77 stop:376 length:300 start_codon:yes stop_codon:yes gene_type:complete
MAKKKSLGSVKKFGPRYGRTVKKKFGIIETEQRKLHECPYCSYDKVKRIAVGIWRCNKCKAKFSGKAYSIKKEITVKKPKEKVIEEEVTEEEQEEKGVE